jgi:hypothetical protein
MRRRIGIGRSAAIAVVAMLSTGCTREDPSRCPTSIEQATQASVIDVELAALMWRIRTFDYAAHTKAIFISTRGGHEPDAALLERLREVSPDVAKHLRTTRPTVDEHGVARDTATGEIGSTLYTGAVEFRTATEASVLVGNGGCGDLCGSETTLVARCVDGVWQAEPVGPGLAF